MCVCVSVGVGVGECIRLAYHKVYGSVCTDYFLHSCLSAIGVSAVLFYFFPKGDIKIRH